MRPAVLDLPWSYEKDGGEGREPGGGVDNNAAREVPDSPLREQAASPYHVHEREVDQNEPDDEEDEVRRETDPVGERAGDQPGVMMANIIW